VHPFCMTTHEPYFGVSKICCIAIAFCAFEYLSWDLWVNGGGLVRGGACSHGWPSGAPSVQFQLSSWASAPPTKGPAIFGS
jgi:hypothetical protein